MDVFEKVREIIADHLEIEDVESIKQNITYE